MGGAFLLARRRGRVTGDVMRIVEVGPAAALVEVADPSAALALASAARAIGVPAVEIVPAARTVLFDGIDATTLQPMLAGLDLSVTWPDRDVVEIPVCYDGPDLEDVAAAWGCDVDTVVERHTGLTFTAAFCGFSPGFAYLAGLPPEWALPRLASPRRRVPAGSVAVADTWCAVYPRASPGGWRLLGSTGHLLWDATAAEPALLSPGARVRFVAR